MERSLLPKELVALRGSRGIAVAARFPGANGALLRGGGPRGGGVGWGWGGGLVTNEGEPKIAVVPVMGSEPFLSGRHLAWVKVEATYSGVPAPGLGTLGRWTWRTRRAAPGHSIGGLVAACGPGGGCSCR